MANFKNKILGSLLGAAIGDAMGAITETRSTEHIIKKFGSLVTDFSQDPPEDNLAHGLPAGTVTDDFSIAYFTAEEIIKSNSKITEDVAKNALVRWHDDGRYNCFIGPSTNVAVMAMKGVKVSIVFGNDELDKRLLCKNNTVTNGGGMKSGMMGVFNPCNVDQAIEDAITMCRPTHNNYISISAACAIAAATAQAFVENTSYLEVLEAGIYGAHVGFEKAQADAKPVAGANVEKKIRLAVEIGLRNQDDSNKAMKEISQIIGGSLFAYDAIPAVFGNIAACKGRAMDSIIMGVNGGDDTDTVACMTGYIVGALSGVEMLNKSYMNLINDKNNFDLEKLADNIDEFVNNLQEVNNA